MTSRALYKLFTKNNSMNATRFFPKRNYSDLDKLQAPHKVDNLEKRFLVWTGKYKTIAEVPNFVGQNVMERARNRMRIRIANYMMLATALGCCLMVYLGKSDKAKGDSIVKRNLEWHRQINEEAKRAEQQQKTQ